MKFSSSIRHVATSLSLTVGSAHAYGSQAFHEWTCAASTTIVPGIATIVTVPTIVYRTSIATVSVPDVCATLTTSTTVTATVETPSKWAMADNTATFSALEPVPTDIDTYDALQKTMGSKENTTVMWWYEGLSIVLPDGLPQTPGLKSQTLMAYRVRHLSSTSMRIDWSELIALGDFQSGDDASFYYNPQSGTNATVPNYYYDGPVSYTISKNGSGLALNITQPAAVITSATITPSVYNGMIQFMQIEKKTKAGANLVSTMTFISSLEDVRNPNITTAKSRGYYYADYEGAISSIFGYPNGTTGAIQITGFIDKGGIDEPLFPRQWATFQKHFPEFFNNATGAVDPDWDTILGDAGIAPL